MGRLIPFAFRDLGPAEWAFLFLALSGLALLARPRWPFAVWAAAIALLVAFIRAKVADGLVSGWDRWGPVFVAPPFVAAAVLVGALPLAELALRRALAALWIGVIAALAAFARPFGLSLAADADAWLLLGLLSLPFAGRALLLRRVGPFRVWQVHSVALLGLCAARGPMGVGWPGAVAYLALLATTCAVLAQGPQMRRYVLRRLIGAPVVLLVLMMVSFAIIRAAPGGPFDKEKRIAPEFREILSARYGFDKPLPEQFVLYVGKLVWDGDLGASTKQKGRTVNQIVEHHAGPSLRLGLAATVLSILIGVTSGVVAGIRRNSIFDYASMTGATVGLALPTFVVGPLLVLVFSMKLGWFRVAGWASARDVVLPAIALALPFAARVARLSRAGMLEIVHQDYIRTARAKGLSEIAIVVRHTLKGALLPVVTYLGPAVALLLTGSLVVETIFGVPGLGVEFVQCALNRDYSLAMGLVVFFGALLIAFNLVVDIAYGFLDPRIRHA
jgi:oligopeptide transport system permease protein